MLICSSTGAVGRLASGSIRWNRNLSSCTSPTQLFSREVLQPMGSADYDVFMNKPDRELKRSFGKLSNNILASRRIIRLLMNVCLWEAVTAKRRLQRPSVDPLTRSLAKEATTRWNSIVESLTSSSRSVTSI